MNSNNYGALNENNQWKPVSIPSDIEYGNNNTTENNYKIDTETSIRLGFIRKVYGILSMQLILTTLMCAVTISSKSVAQFQMTHPGFLWLSLIASIVILLTVCCIPGMSRNVPTNYLLLFAFTFFEGYMVSAICATTSPKLVLMAASMTCAITIALTVYACTTKTDFTLAGSILFIAAMSLFLLSIFAIFFKFLHVVVATLGIFLYAIYLVYDTQLLIGNKENALDIEDYILGALMLYMDIINMFIYILQLLKYFNNDS